MKGVSLIIIILTILYVSKVDAQQYSLACGKIISIKQNKAEVDIFSKTCHGKHYVTIVNKKSIQDNLINKVNYIMQIDQNCSQVILANIHNKGAQ